ncbi:ribosome silencing factor [Thermicanus aegyptius]|uniref:ribosome silencing factor n=1 Tax=Thermicanus aegyptius TaxID=94009 RepID=UPI00034AE9BA|nr:ribosome silencing factor [Thermicanus aegyptius]MBE3555159.1 ribosome silencing factor [Thermicanus sp.]
MKIEEIAQLAAQTAMEKKGQNTIILKLEGLSIIADYFVITHGNNEPQVEAIATAIREKMEEKGIHIRGIEGLSEKRWVLLDLGDVVVHIFHRDEREFYHLERIWADAPEIPVEKEAKMY